MSTEVATDARGHRLERIEAVQPGYAKTFVVDGMSVLLVCGENGARAMHNVCPHAGSPLEGGRVLGHRFRCPRHGYIFDLNTGASARGSREGFGPLRFLDLVEDDGFYAVVLS